MNSSPHPQVRTIDPPFSVADFAPPDPELQTVQFKTLPDDATLQRMAEFVGEHVHLRLERSLATTGRSPISSSCGSSLTSNE